MDLETCNCAFGTRQKSYLRELVVTLSLKQLAK
jgi:hypothetical protein